LFGDPNDPFRLSASRAPDGTLSQYYYDQAGLLIGLERAGERFYVITDQVGSPRLIVNKLAVIQREISYNVFGEIISDSGGFELVIGFSGGRYDQVTGLNRMGFRDYDAETGRWTSRDPILFRGGQFNLYVYVGNNPVSKRDPSGLICVGGGIYSIGGGGGKLCYDNGKWSLCLEIGLGVGGGISLDLDASTAPRSDADYVEAKASIGCGPFKTTTGLKLDDCGNFLLSSEQQFGVYKKKREKNFTTGEIKDSDSGELSQAAKDPKDAGKPPKNPLSCNAGVSLSGGVCFGSDF